MRHLFLFLTCLYFFSSCSSVPEHARYLPNDAVVVTGINLKEMSKEIAWSVFSGSKLFEEMTRRMDSTGNNTLNDLDKAGINAFSTCYAYIQTVSGFEPLVTVLIPLDDEKKWEQFAQTHFHEKIREVNNRKQIQLSETIYASWTNSVLVIMQQPTYEANEDTEENISLQSQPLPDIAGYMDKVFNLPKEQSLINDKRFYDFEKQAYDLTCWVNHDRFLNHISENNASISEFSIARNLWKGVAMAAGINFEKGKMKAEVKYFTSEVINSFAEKFVRDADKELIARLPKDNLHFATAFYCSSDGVKGILENTGILGFLNLAFMDQGISTNDIFNAFTGDMAFAVHDFRIQTQVNESSDTTKYTDVLSEFSAVYAMKIHKKEAFDKLIQYAVKQSYITPYQENVWCAITGSDTVFMALKGDFIAWSNEYKEVTDYLDGHHKSKEGHPALKKSLVGYPFAMFVDYRTIFDPLKQLASTMGYDVGVQKAENLLDYAVVHGGSYRNHTFDFEASLYLRNKDENSLIQLIHFVTEITENAQP